MKHAESPRFEDAIFQELPLMATSSGWDRLFEGDGDVKVFERDILPVFIKKCRWFGGKAKVITDMKIQQHISLDVEGETHYLLILEVYYQQRTTEYYFLPVSFARERSLAALDEYTSHSLICRAHLNGETGCVTDSSYRHEFRNFLFTSMQRGRQLLDEDNGILVFSAGAIANAEQASRILKADQSNTAIIYGDQYFFKIYRKVEREINPDLEIIRFLTESTTFRHAPRYAGSVEYLRADASTMVLGMLQENVANLGDAWVMTMGAMTEYYDAVMGLPVNTEFPALIESDTMSFDNAPALIRQLIGRAFSDRVMLLAQRTAEMHRALSSELTDPAFAPEPITHHDQEALYSALTHLLNDRFGMLEDSLERFDTETRALANEILSYRDHIEELAVTVKQAGVSALKARIHGDYHLGQVLFTGDDFVIIDFEGEPALSFRDRRLKRSPLKDVAGMMRSFHYAAYGKILLDKRYRSEDSTILEKAAEQWQYYVSRFFLGSYMAHADLGSNLSTENTVLIRTFLLEKAIYELGYELNARPDWVKIPLKGIQYLVRRDLGHRDRPRPA